MPPPVHVRAVKAGAATPAVLDRIADLLMLAFGQDRLMQTMSGESEAAQRGLLRRRAESSVKHDGLWIATLGEDISIESMRDQDIGNIMGVMVMDPAGVESPPTFEGAPISVETQKWAKESLGPAMKSLETDGFGAGGKTASVYIHFLAVDPASRGTGVGRKLVETAFEQADAQGIDTTLLNNSEGNLAIYGRLGFKPVGHATFESANGGRHPFWAMTRPPKNHS